MASKKFWITSSVCGGLGLAIAGVGIYSYTHLTSARDHLNDATRHAAALQDALTTGEAKQAPQRLATLQASVNQADDALSHPVLSVASKVPFIGKNISAVRDVTTAVKRISDLGLEPLVDVAGDFNSKAFNPRGGKVDIDAIRTIAPSLEKSSAVMKASANEVNRIETDSLLDAVQKPVIDVQQKISQAANIASRATHASAVLPNMLSGKQRYLMVFQNNAEIRATGGLAGAWAVLEVNDGRITLGEQGTGGSMGDLPDDALPITDEELALFDTQLVRDFRNINFTPDFPRASAIAASIFKDRHKVDVDGVVSIDPVALSYLLKGTGPITLKDGTILDHNNAVELLLNTVYVNYPDGAQQDQFFAEATQSIVSTLLDGAGKPSAVLSGLTRATNERRLSVWSADEVIQERLAGTALAAELPTGDAARTAIGFYLNDATGAKMQYYLDRKHEVVAATCSADNVQTYKTVTTLRSTAPADAADLPVSIRGPGFGAPAGSMLMNLYVYAPTGGKVTSLTIDGKEVTTFSNTHHGRAVEEVTVEVGPGKTVSVEATVTTAKGVTGDAVVYSTPSIQPEASVTRVKTGC